MARWVGTTEVLGNAEEYTSEAVLRDRHQRVEGTVFADQIGTLHVEQSIDGTNWDLDNSNSIVADTGEVVQVDLVAPYWRLRYVNGATPQTEFRLGASGVDEAKDA